MDETSSRTMRNRRKSNSAIAMVLLMLMSTQMYNFQDFERDDPEESDWGAVPQRTAYQQMNQASGPVSGGTQ